MKKLRTIAWPLALLFLLMPGGNGIALAATSPSVQISTERLPSKLSGSLESPGSESPLSCPLSDNLLELALLDDAADGSLDQHTLAAAGLIASGVRDAIALQSYVKRLEALCAEIEREMPAERPSRERAQRVFALMYDRVLTGDYAADCTDFREALDAGRFNCVSSTLLFQVLADAAGLKTKVVTGRNHVFAVLETAGEEVDVQTTCPDWFAVIDDPQRQAVRLSAILNSTGAQGSSLTDRTAVGPCGLISLVYYNEGVDLLERNEFAAAVAANRKALALDPQNLAARGNLLAATNNWALKLNAEGKTARAITLLESGLEYAPGHELFRSNYVAIFQHWLPLLIAQRDWDQALSAVDRARRALPDESCFQAARAELFLRRSSDLLEGGQPLQGEAMPAAWARR